MTSKPAKGLNRLQMKELLMGKQTTHSVIVRRNGKLVHESVSPTEYGSFVGKTSTRVRSSSGNVRPLLNGRRVYEQTMRYDSEGKLEGEVVMYDASPR